MREIVACFYVIVGLAGACHSTHAGSTSRINPSQNVLSQATRAPIVGVMPADSAAVRIHSIQGKSLSSPISGARVTVEAIVVGEFQGDAGLKGFFIQEEDAHADRDPLTSEGIFVYDPDARAGVRVGDQVRLSGHVTEYFGLTELTRISSLKIIASNVPLPASVSLQLPLDDTSMLERFEGMRVRLPQSLTVTGHYQLHRYGVVSLSSGGRLMAPTQRVRPGMEAGRQQKANDLNRILLDDGSLSSYPDPTSSSVSACSAKNTLRVGNTVKDVTGVLDFRFGSYRIQPTAPVGLSNGSPRPKPPRMPEALLKIASFNVLNYFNGDGHGGGFPAVRGARSLSGFERQRRKIINALEAMDADIFGLMELENDGFNGASAIQDLVNGLNERVVKSVRYMAVNPGLKRVGHDAITVGIIYRANTVKPIGRVHILDASVDSHFNDHKNRPVLAQTFEELRSGERFTVVVGHLKSKGSDCDDAKDFDAGDGQGNCNQTRTDAAKALVKWLATDPTGSEDPDILLIGDLNAHAREDPIEAIKRAGFIDLIHAHVLPRDAYTYVYQGQSAYLDYALANHTLASQIVDTQIWHINADEPLTKLCVNDYFRSSDHDPVVVGLKLHRPRSH